ncbi:MAG: glycosyltransferase, partial [Marmoricola sp.]
AVAGEVEAGWGFTPTVIPNGVDAARFAAAVDDGPGRARWRDQLGCYALALGGIEPRKGSIDLLEAMSVVQQHHPELRLVFAGGETLFDYRDYRLEFERRAGELRVNYEVLGVIPDDRLPSLVAQASVLGFASTKEGFGLAAMEALAAGVPVVARDLPVLREVFLDTVVYGTNVVSLAAGILNQVELPLDPGLGRELAASYTWDAAAAAHQKFYAAFVESGVPTVEMGL